MTHTPNRSIRSSDLIQHLLTTLFHPFTHHTPLLSSWTVRSVMMNSVQLDHPHHIRYNISWRPSFVPSHIMAHYSLSSHPTQWDHQQLINSIFLSHPVISHQTYRLFPRHTFWIIQINLQQKPLLFFKEGIAEGQLERFLVAFSNNENPHFEIFIFYQNRIIQSLFWSQAEIVTRPLLCLILTLIV